MTTARCEAGLFQGITMTPITKPELANGERYIGAIVDAAGVATHIILLPGSPKATWKAAKTWAASIGGDLPNRVEQALLFATAKDEFEEYGYWSNELYASVSGFAWSQYFDYGYQYDHGVYGKLRARAVRRLIIQ